METIKAGDSNWNQKEITATCPYCGCICKGKVGSDFAIITDNPKYYNYEGTCPTCGNKIKF